jgi:hypothetical protein
MSSREKFFFNGFDKVENVQEKGRIDERRRELQEKSTVPIWGGGGNTGKRVHEE